MHRLAATLGISAVGLFGIALVVFSGLNPGFDPLDDYVSKLGALGQPHAMWWNVIGFVAVGALLAGFGLAYGRILHDRFVGVLLALFGIGFGAAGIPLDLGDGNSPLAKAHVVAICLGLAAWLFGLARMAHLTSLGNATRSSANIAAGLLVLPILGQGAQWWSMPVTHRLVFLVVFGWVAITSIRLLRGVAAPGCTRAG
ncbi:MAG: DUF998 domain-containing protein [Bryobacterales bacterium]|nr:DUF998 domain-containing protein [Bryobacterales bacterium]